MTAQKREENPKDVPVTMAVFSGADIEQQGLQDLTDYAKFVPGLIYNGEGLGGERSGPDIVIRGIADSTPRRFGPTSRRPPPASPTARCRPTPSIRSW